MDMKKNRLLICAPSNAAVDEILRRLLAEGTIDANGHRFAPQVVRLGKPLEGSSPAIEEITLDNRIDSLLQREAVWDQMKTSSSSLNDMIQNYKAFESTYIRDDKEQVKRKMKMELNKLRSTKLIAEASVNIRRVAIRKMIFETADIVAATLSSSGQSIFLDHIVQEKITFETVIVDEAAQSTEPATLIPVRYGCRRLVLVGDTRQLPPYVCSKEAESNGLATSLFERLESAGHEIVMLTVRLSNTNDQSLSQF
jgi:senataxin